MEKVETNYGLLVSVIGVWFLLDGILNLISNWNIIFWSITWQGLLFLLGFPVIDVILGILGLIAGLLIYKGNLKGGMLALISGIIGVTLGVVGGLVNIYSIYPHLNLLLCLSFIGSIIGSISLPTLLLIAGIEKYSRKLGVLITTTGAFMTISYGISLLTTLYCFISPGCHTALEWIVLGAIFTTVVGLGIVAGVSIYQRLSRGYKLSILAGTIGIMAATAYAIIMIFGGPYPIPLLGIINGIILQYQPPTIFVVGGILARE